MDFTRRDHVTQPSKNSATPDFRTSRRVRGITGQSSQFYHNIFLFTMKTHQCLGCKQIWSSNKALSTHKTHCVAYKTWWKNQLKGNNAKGALVEEPSKSSNQAEAQPDMSSPLGDLQRDDDMITELDNLVSAQRFIERS